MSVTDELIRNNDSYSRGFDQASLPIPPSKQVAVVSCMDARVNPYEILGLSDGDAHIIRNAGGVVTDDVIRSLVISQRLLGTREIVLIHHTDCGMLTLPEDEVKAEIETEVGVRPLFSFESFADLEEDVRQSIARIEANPFIPNKGSIRGFVYDVETGRLEEIS